MSLDVYLTMELDTGGEVPYVVELFESNITHNLNVMAQAVSEDFYKALWRPEEIGIKTASQLTPILEQGLGVLISDPVKFKKYDPDNGWGSYETLIGFVVQYIQACKEHPKTTVNVSK